MEERVDTAAGLLTLRPARRSDAPEVLGLRRRVIGEGSWFVTRPDELVDDVEVMAANIADHGRSPNSVFLLAHLGGRLCGLVAVRGGVLQRQRHVGRLEIMVAADVRGLGVGRALMDAAVRWAEANALVRKLSLAVYADNERAIHMYRSFGFVQEGRREGEYRDEAGAWLDDLLMARWVGPSA